MTFHRIISLHIFSLTLCDVMNIRNVVLVFNHWHLEGLTKYLYISSTVLYYILVLTMHILKLHSFIPLLSLGSAFGVGWHKGILRLKNGL